MALNIPAGLKIVMSDGNGLVLDVDAPLTPEEIALAIIAEVVAVRRGGTGASLSRQLRPMAF